MPHDLDGHERCKEIAHMTTTRIDAAYVLFLAGESLATGSVPVPEGAVGIWCREPAEIEDRARRLRPCCVILDVGGRSNVAEIVRASRQAAGEEAILAVLGAPADTQSVVDCVVQSSEDVSRLVRFALGQSVRVGERVTAAGRAVAETSGGQQLELAIVDLSEEGVRVATLPGLPDEGILRLRICLPDAREIAVRARPVRRVGDNGHSTIAYQFVDLDARSRGLLRAYLLRRNLATGVRSGETRAPGTLPRSRGRAITIIGKSSAFARALETLHRVAPNEVTVLLLGETGTGKELAARALHEGSPRTDRPFVAVNCAALPENLVESELFGHEPGAFTGATKRKIGRIEQASSGTLFLDEIGDLPAGAQAKLLRALQERVIERVGGSDAIRVDIRLIAATNQDLEEGMAKRNFRRDLFFRLNVVAVTLPPLRERIEDVPLLVDHFLARAQEKMGKRDIRLNEYASDTLLRYPWPGNVRELENLCTRLVALAQSGAVLGPEHLNLFIMEDLADSPLPSTDLRDILDFCEREIVKRMLDRHGGNRTKTARALGISRQALQQKLARFRGAGNGGGADPSEAA
jgi:two-component system response regulator HydG